MLELGGYFNEADFNQLEVWGYQNLYLRGGPIPTAEGQVSIQAGSVARRRHGDQLAELPADVPLGARGVGARARARGRRRPRLRPLPRRGVERIGVTDSCSELNGPHQRLKEGCEALGWDFKLITRNVDPARHDPDLAGYVGFGDVTGSKLSTQKTYLADARERGADLVVNCRAERILVEDGRAAGVEGTYDRPRRLHGAGRGSRATGRRGLRLDRVARAAAALGDRRPRRRRLPAPASGRRPCSPPTTSRRTAGGARRSPRSPIEFAEGRDGHGFLLEGAHHCDRAHRRRGALGVRAPAQGGDGPVQDHLRADLADPRPRARPGRRRRGGQRRPELPPRRRSRRRQLPRRARGGRPRPRGGGRRADLGA